MSFAANVCLCRRRARRYTRLLFSCCTPMSASSPSPAAAETRALLHLAVPIMVAQLSHTATGFVDTLMSGRLGAEALAAVSIGASVMISVFITLSGVAAALNPLVAHHIGAQQPEQVGPTVRQGR